jgi:hypothetical protein
MRLPHWILLLSVCFVVLAFGATPVTTTTPTKKAIPKNGATVRKTTGKTAGKSVSTRRARGSAAPVAARQSRQQTPAPERYKEIQQALTDKGYLKSEPTGVWNTESSDALRQFQTENNLSPTGKLSAASLIGLGLGPKKSNEPVVLPVAPPVVPQVVPPAVPAAPVPVRP